MGTHLAKMLSGNGHEITVVDVNSKALAEIDSLVDVVTVEGDTTQFSVLRKSGVRKCDLFIAVRSVENDNILSAVVAKQMGAKKAIARVDSSEYLEPNSKEVFIDKVDVSNLPRLLLKITIIFNIYAIRHNH